MIYLDSSVALAHLLTEDKRPPETLWDQPLVSSRLLRYEIWSRLHVRGLGASDGDRARGLIGLVWLVELSPRVLERALAPFPVSVRTLDGLHLATVEFLRNRGQTVELASYDKRLLAAARALNVPICEL
ncbi:MAG TPA: hypothetical protein VF744_13365 [Beijerinckiaceae bacterium]